MPTAQPRRRFERHGASLVRRRSVLHVPIGRPLAELSGLRSGRLFEPVPSGVVGELYIAGVGLARGYLAAFGSDGGAVCGRPAWRAAWVAGERMYRTGDLARWRARRGAGVSGAGGCAGEASRVPDRAWRDRGCAAAAAGRVAGGCGGAGGWRAGPRLVGYVVAAAAAEGGGLAAVDAVGLRAALSQVLPEYMVPSALVVLDRLPLTPNGKLDRRALPSPELAPRHAHRAPRTPQEEILCGLFAEVLGVARVGIDDNFFELGGDSIVSIQLVSRARRAGLSITPRAVFQQQTVAALAALAGLVAEPGPALAEDGLAEDGWPVMRSADCRRRRSCTGSRSAAGRSVGSARRCCCRFRRGCGRIIWRRRLRRCWIITTRCGCGLMRSAADGEWRP